MGDFTDHKQKLSEIRFFLPFDIFSKGQKNNNRVGRTVGGAHGEQG